MKIITNIRNSSHSLLVANALLLVLVLGSCKEEDEINVGPPTIERVRNTDPTSADSAFTSATLGSTLAIMGNNLLGTQQVYLNDYPLGVNTAYVTNNTVIVTVGDSVPTVATNPDVPNTLRLVNKAGEAIMDFQTLPPAPQITQVKNQYVKPGDELTLFGRYFYFVDTVYFPGEDVYVTSGFQTNSAGSSLTVTVPEGLDFSESQAISVVTRSGGSATNRNTQIYADKGMVADFDTNGALVWPWEWGWGMSGDMIRPSQPGIEGIDGNFGGMNQPFPANYGWNNDKVINLTNWSGLQIFPEGEGYEPSAPAASFDIRFEVAINTTESIEGLEMQIWFPDANGNELSYNIPMADFVKTTDGSWYTLSANMTRLTNGSTRLNTYGDFLQGDGFAKQLRLVVINTTANDIQAVLGVDNIRVIRAVN
ncbi:glycan-binding surface protein [Algoriphagus halophytocola]|uniref:Glycan-binding surface protein n=1 Tax=Algoriphagus halophytocola TaxID=2991499 RepID=A0ABY6MJ69_9BACT|nr:MULTISPECIES: glycan-binding surface protein [unclassified Algoriphagus]UZD23820.1 glycan-binding surface protein [Algoriphagus sp. TR-M5]WBL41187.1 glycan-binding surface protein [Algoriphagus sp. TR-M9]